MNSSPLPTLTWESPLQTNAYEPLYLANGTFGGMLDLSGSTMALWSSEIGVRSSAPETEEELWPITCLRTQVFYRNAYWREADFWIGNTGIHCKDPLYEPHDSMPHIAQVYQTRQSLNLEAGLATTEGVLYPGSQAGLEAGLQPERSIPFKTRIAFLKDSTVMGIEISANADTEILFLPELVLEEIFQVNNTGSGIATLGNRLDYHLEFQQSIIDQTTGSRKIEYTVQPDGDLAYQVIVECADAELDELKGWKGFRKQGSLFCTVQIVPGSKSPEEELPHGAEAFFSLQAERWHNFWKGFNIQLPKSEQLWQERYYTSLFYVAQSMGDGAINPVGLSKPMLPYWHGCFHDTDTYFARPLLETGHFAEANRHLRYRHRTLPRAIELAEGQNRSGAWYPWQTDHRGDGELIDVPINTAIIAVEAWHHFLHTRKEEDRDMARPILAGVLKNLLDHVDFNQQPMTLKEDPIMTFSEVMKGIDPTEVRLSIRALAAALLSAGHEDADLLATCRQVLDELKIPESSEEGYLFSGLHNPQYMRNSSVTLGSFPLHHLPANDKLGKAYDRELANLVSLFAWIPYQVSVVGSQLQRKEGPTSGIEIMRQADSYFKGPWHAFDEWENRRTVRAAIFVTSAGGFCTALHHLLLAETAPAIWSLWAGVPDEWKDLSFNNIHTRAGWVVSATRKNGKTVNWEARPVSEAADPEFNLMLDEGELHTLKISQ
ncbi:MAG: hypothetical protein AB3N33_02495 [Puniceicoccaceae bacterium]